MILYSSIPVRKSGRISGQKMDLGHFVRILGQFSGQKRSDLLLTSIKNNIPRPGGKPLPKFSAFLSVGGLWLYLVRFCFLSQITL